MKINETKDYFGRYLRYFYMEDGSKYRISADLDSILDIPDTINLCAVENKMHEDMAHISWSIQLHYGEPIMSWETSKETVKEDFELASQVARKYLEGLPKSKQIENFNKIELKVEINGKSFSEHSSIPTYKDEVDVVEVFEYVMKKITRNANDKVKRLFPNHNAVVAKCSICSTLINSETAIFSQVTFNKTLCKICQEKENK